MTEIIYVVTDSNDTVYVGPDIDAAVSIADRRRSFYWPEYQHYVKLYEATEVAF